MSKTPYQYINLVGKNLKTEINGLNSGLDGLTTTGEQLRTQVTSLSNALNTKADKTEITALSDALDTKADISSIGTTIRNEVPRLFYVRKSRKK